MTRVLFLALALALHTSVGLLHPSSPLVSNRRTRSRAPLRDAVQAASLVEAEVSGSSETTVVVQAAAVAQGKHVDVTFTDGTTFRFHALWLRDSCRDPNHVVAAAGERILTTIPAMNGISGETLLAAGAEVNSADGSVQITWTGDSSEAPGTSHYDGSFLRAYADIVAEPLATSASVDTAKVDWLKPYTGYPGALAPRPEQLTLWKNEDGLEFPRYTAGEALNDPAVHLQLLQDLLRVGAVLVDEVDEAEDNESLQHFATAILGGLQKDPCRDESNWKIVRKANAKSISYDPIKRLINHTDQSVPPWGGVPGLVLMMHYVLGKGCNTLTDGFAVGKALKERDPEAYDLLCTYGNDQARDFLASRSDAAQSMSGSLLVEKRERIFQLDNAGDLVRLQFNEVFRTPLTLPFDVFPKWYAAYTKFVDMLHSKEFEVDVPMQKGTILIMNNWRVLHGRAGGQASSDRTLVGGTVTREAFYSRARQVIQKVHGDEFHLTEH